MNHEKVALVFGGARGIGAAIAVRLAHEDYRIGLPSPGYHARTGRRRWSLQLNVRGGRL